MPFVLVVACGGSTPPPEQPKPEPAVAPPPPPPEPEPVAEPEPEPEEPEEPKEEPKGPRRPLATYNNPSGPITVGFDGAVVRTSGAELRIQGGSLRAPRNVLFQVDKKFRGARGKLGDVYMLGVQVPDREYNMNTARPSQPFATSGDPFVLKLPLPEGRDSANLAVESVQVDDKDRAKSTWVVVAQTKLETADTGNRAVFEMSQLPDAHVYLTTQDVSSGE